MRQSEAERLELLRQEMLNAYQGEQHSINHFLTNLEEVYAHIAALQAQVEHLEAERLNVIVLVDRAERAEAVLRRALETIKREWQGQLGTGQLLTEFCNRALSEQSAKPRHIPKRPYELLDRTPKPEQSESDDG